MNSLLFNKKLLYNTLLILIAANVFIWWVIAFGGEAKNLELYFLDVGQGDGQLVNFHGSQILIDGGKGPKVLSSLAKALRPGDRYIDIVIATHPDFDHFGGLIDVLKTYQVGLVITNGRDGVASASADFKKAITENKITAITMAVGDRIKYEDLTLTALWPEPSAVTGKKTNESGIVLLLEKDGLPGLASLRALYTADIGFETEQRLVTKYDLSAHILKVAHHGSKYSSGREFLSAIQPRFSVISVGKNTYGHPTDAALNRLADIGSQIFRTDRDGTIKMIFDGENLKVYR